MLQPDAFCEHTMQQNATAAEAPPRTPLGPTGGAYTAPPDSLVGFKRTASRRGGEGKEERGREMEERGREGREGKERIG